MPAPLFSYFSRLRSFLRLTPLKRDTYLSHPRRSFTRRSPLNFGRTAALVLGLLRKSTTIELHDFFEHFAMPPVTKSAFSQRRKLIKPSFFQHAFHQSAQQFYKVFTHFHRFRGLRVFAIDGSGQRLPNEPSIVEAFGDQPNQFGSSASTRLLFTFDILNRILLRVDLHNRYRGELSQAYLNVKHLPRKAIYIYDRGFGGYGLPFLHKRHGSYFVIRLKLSAFPAVQELIQSDDNEHFIEVSLNANSFRKLSQLGLKPERNATLCLRLVKVILPTGEREVLMTNLMDRNRFHHKRIAELYAWRWGVETAIHNLKSFLQLALCSAYTQPGVEQDLWSTFWSYNLGSAIAFAGQEDIEHKTAHRKYEYQINRNVAAGLIKRFIPILLCGGQRRWRAKTLVLTKQICQCLEPYRLRPSRVRKRKLIRSQDRHFYEANYRSTM